MDNVIRHATVIVDLKSGKMEIETTDLAQLLAAKEKQVELEKRVNEQSALSKFYSDELAKAKDKETQATERHTGAVHHNAFEQAKAFREIVHGGLLVTRAFVEMGISSEESLQKVLHNLAAVHAGLDLFKGSIMVIKGVAAAFGVAEAALTVFMGPATIVIGAIAAIGTGFMLWNNHAREAAEAERELAGAIAERTRALNDAREEENKAREDARKGLEGSLFRGMSPADKERELLRRQMENRAALGVADELMSDRFKTRGDPDRVRLQQDTDPATLRFTLLQQQEDLRQELEQVRKQMEDEAKKQIAEGIKNVSTIFRGLLDSVTSIGHKQTAADRVLNAIKASK